MLKSRDVSIFFECIEIPKTHEQYFYSAGTVRWIVGLQDGSGGLEVMCSKWVTTYTRLKPKLLESCPIDIFKFQKASNPLE